MTTAQNQGDPCIEVEHLLPSEVAAISPFVDDLLLLITKFGCVPGSATEIEIALREALANAIIHGNHKDPQKHVYVRCWCKPNEVAIEVADEGRGFDLNKTPDPTSPANRGSHCGRGILLMKAFMDDVRFDRGGAVVRMRKSANDHTH